MVLFAAALLSVPSLYAQTPAAMIREVTGRVEIQAPGSPAWVPASAGMAVEKAARVSTGFKSTAVIAAGNSTITVRPLTRLTLEEIAGLEENEQAGLYLESGRVRAEVTLPSGGTIDFSVRSPIVTASVRGTAFEFDTVNLTVDNGRVQFTSVNGSLAAVRAGERSAVNEKTYIVIPPREADILTLPPGSESGGRLNGDGPATTVQRIQGSNILVISSGW
jgi:hypothetical protein